MVCFVLNIRKSTTEFFIYETGCKLKLQILILLVNCPKLKTKRLYLYWFKSYKHNKYALSSILKVLGWGACARPPTTFVNFSQLCTQKRMDAGLAQARLVRYISGRWDIFFLGGTMSAQLGFMASRLWATKRTPPGSPAVSYCRYSYTM